jgi:dihydrofolate reductase
MRRVISVCSVTLDGVMQAPGRPEEDTRGGFSHGGWAGPYNDPQQGARVAQAAPNDMLFGRRTYEDFFSVWPNRGDNPFTTVLNNRRKYVVSRTLAEPLPWQNSTLLSGEAAQTVAALKAGDGPDLVILGSGDLVRSLTAAGLIDEFRLGIHPLVLGEGTRLFADTGPEVKLQLVEATPSAKGVIHTVYRPT